MKIFYVRKFLKKILRYFLYLLEKPIKKEGIPKSKSDLIALERYLGGTHRGVPVREISPLDFRQSIELKKGMIGGDKMFFHQYADIYLSIFRYIKEPKNIAEIGILKGAGLGLLSFIFPQAKLYGFDIDPSHFLACKKSLKAKGAFKINDPEIRDFDQLNPALDSKDLPLFDLIIDDGLHSQESIDNTLDCFIHLLSPGGIYVVEDLPSGYINSPLVEGYRYLCFEEMLVIFND